jgi:hypothetical protein
MLISQEDAAADLELTRSSFLDDVEDFEAQGLRITLIHEPLEICLEASYEAGTESGGLELQASCSNPKHLLDRDKQAELSQVAAAFLSELEGPEGAFSQSNCRRGEA